MVNNAALVAFRIMYGLLMTIESFGAIGTGWVYRTYVGPKMTFPALVENWPQPLPGYGMYAWFVVMGLHAVGVMVGWRYRYSATVLAFMWTFAYLTQKTNYNNHYYLAVLICWAMVFLPAHRRAAFDVGQRVSRATTCAAWIPLAFKVQLAVVFIFAAIAKLYPGWVEVDYLRHVFSWRASRPVIGPLLVQPWFQTIIMLGGIFFDGLVVPALWWRPTRVLAFLGLILFNLFNSVVFLIGVFPYMVLALSVFFFDVDRVVRLFSWVPGFVNENDPPDPTPPSLSEQLAPAGPIRWILAVYFALQVGLPLRHHLIEGDVNWTEEGHRLSWRMMMHSKSGHLKLVAEDPATKKRWVVDQTEWLTRKQQGRIATRPDMLYQFVQRLKAHYAAEGKPEVRIFAARSAVSLNGGPAAPLYDPKVDLASVGFDRWVRNKWVLDYSAPDIQKGQ